MMTASKKTWVPIIIIGTMLTTACKDEPVVQHEAEYAVMTVTPSDRTLTTSYSGSIRGRQDIDIYPQVRGTLTKLCVTEG